MTDPDRQEAIALGRSRSEKAAIKRALRFYALHSMLAEEVREAARKPLLPIVERMHAEADAERDAA